MADFAEMRQSVSLAPFTTLKAGGRAEKLAVVHQVDELAIAVALTHSSEMELTVLGWGSNVLPSDAGVPGLVLINRTNRILVSRLGEVVADTGATFQELFLKTAQAGLRGLEFAVGIPGSVGGALVSNAGAYRSCVSEFLTSVEIVNEGKRQWVEPGWLDFSYRDSVFRRANPPRAAMLRVALQLPSGQPKSIYDEARDYQRQRISKQPPPASAGSFFKNVNDFELAQKVEGLSEGMRGNGVIPAGFLLEQCGLKGHRLGGAMFGSRHANFILNVGGATATDIRKLAVFGKKVVFERFGVTLEEEVLYLGDWTSFPDQ